MISASQAYQTVLAQFHIQVSMSGKGNCYDHAMLESFFSSLKTECVHRHAYQSRSEAQSSIFEWIVRLLQPTTMPFLVRVRQSCYLRAADLSSVTPKKPGKIKDNMEALCKARREVRRPEKYAIKKQLKTESRCCTCCALIVRHQNPWVCYVHHLQVPRRDARSSPDQTPPAAKRDKTRFHREEERTPMEGFYKIEQPEARKAKKGRRTPPSLDLLPHDIAPAMIARWKTYHLGLISFNDLLDGWLTDLETSDLQEIQAPDPINKKQVEGQRSAPVFD